MRLHGRRLLHVGTDEVYGDIPEGRLSVEDGSDAFRAYHETRYRRRLRSTAPGQPE